MSNILLNIKHILNDPRAAVLCIVTAVSGSSPGKAGAKMIVYEDGKIDGTVGGGGIEKHAIREALRLMNTQSPVLANYNLEADFGMTCGGTASVYYEPLIKPSKLYIFGAGHIGKFLAGYAPDMGFDTVLIDWRTDLLEGPEPCRYQKVCKPYLEAVSDIQAPWNSYVVIVTPNHEMDEEVLAAVGKMNLAYLGLIGSRRKIATLRQGFLEKGLLGQEELDKVDMPIGIKFNAVTPAEIAISILAKLIDVKNSMVRD